MKKKAPAARSKRSQTTLSKTRSLRELVRDEDGYVSKETVLKAGLTTIAALGALGAGSTASAEHTNHQNALTSPSGCFQHTNTVTHSSY